VSEIFAPIAMLRREVYLTAVLISIAIAAVLGFFLALALRRLDRAAQAMRRMSQGEEPFAAIPVTRDDEIGRLEDNFNQLMAERDRLDQALRSEAAAHKQARGALEEAMARLQALSQHMTRAQEQERRKLAFELHEQSGQELSALNMHLQMLERQSADATAKDRLNDARAIAGMALERVRSLSYELHPMALENFGLHVALHGRCMELAEAAGWVVHFDAPRVPERPAPDVELACFRVAEQALDNVARHAKATEVWVSLREAQGELQLSVRDNGVGFDPPAAAARLAQTEFGLVAMEERARQLGGHVEVCSSPNGGTEVRAAFPLAPKR
jgi:signal transduction histidine kinase